MRPRFRHLAGVTTGLTFVLILLGVYTAATGSGLSCQARWPLCGGPLFGLLPPNLASLPEWTHRLVAMVTGFAILGTAVDAWRRGLSRRVRVAATLAVVVLPVQVLFGAGTVLFYGPTIQVVHHAAALVIFGSLLAATLWAYDGGSRTGRSGAVATDD
ncbi:MAG: COX15/CtaA family protein [Halobacteriaceae archaeon]